VECLIGYPERTEPVWGWCHPQFVAGDAYRGFIWIRSLNDVPGMAVTLELKIHVSHRECDGRGCVLIHGMRKVSHSGRVVDRRYRHADGGRVGVQLPIAGPVGEAGGAIPVWLGSEGHLIASDRDGAVGGVRCCHDAVGQRVTVDVGTQQGGSACSVFSRGQGYIAGHRGIVHWPYGYGNGGRIRDSTL